MVINSITSGIGDNHPQTLSGIETKSHHPRPVASWATIIRKPFQGLKPTPGTLVVRGNDATIIRKPFQGLKLKVVVTD